MSLERDGNSCSGTAGIVGRILYSLATSRPGHSCSWEILGHVTSSHRRVTFLNHVSLPESLPAELLEEGW